jgi:hypothetical protein
MLQACFPQVEVAEPVEDDQRAASLEHPMKVTATVLRDDRWMPVQDAAQGRPILSVCYTTTLRLLS